MAVHDWTRVFDGLWHDLHISWLIQLRDSLNDALLPADYYALAEQHVGPLGPDVLTLQSTGFGEDDDHSMAVGGGPGTAAGVEIAQPKPSVGRQFKLEAGWYARRHRTVTIRHRSGDRVVAMIELVSPGNKSSRQRLAQFVRKATDALANGIHLLVVDLFPPSPRDPRGIHAAIWEELGEDPSDFAPDRPLTLASYDASADADVAAYVEMTAVGRALTDMPLFFHAERYVNIPLEATYMRAFEKVPARWRAVLDGPAEPSS